MDYQLLGGVEEVLEESVMDGHSEEMESRPPMPQVESEFIVKVDKILHFSNAPHSDIENE